jgi:hypothetical protein
MTGRIRVAATLAAVALLATVAHADLRYDAGRSRRALRAVERDLAVARRAAGDEHAAATRAGERARDREAELAAAGDRAVALAEQVVASLADGEDLTGALGDDLTAVADDLRSTTEASRRAADRAAADDAVAGAGVQPPVLPYDFADPDVVAVGGSYYGYATNGGGGNVQLIRSSDMAHWEWLGDAMPALPSWAPPHRTWAPSVLPRQGDDVLYVTVGDGASGRQCIAAAVAARPEGPFVDGSTRPFMCQRERGGSIDPSTFVDDDGRTYLLWKSEDETVGGRATLWSAPLAPSGLAFAGGPGRSSPPTSRGSTAPSRDRR